MTEQLALFTTQQYFRSQEITHAQIDTDGYDPTWDDLPARTESPAVEPNNKFEEGDTACILVGDRAGTLGRVVGVDGVWVSLYVGLGQTEVVLRSELSLEFKACDRDRIRPSGLSVSFGKALPQLLCGLKTVTRRTWKDSHARKFIRAWDRELSIRMLDKDLRYGGKQIGWMKLTCCPYRERLSDMPESDVSLEGFPELSKAEFIDRFFDKSQDQSVWVVRFETALFDAVRPEPNNPAVRRSKTRDRACGWVETERKTRQGKRKTSTYTYFYYRYEVWQDGNLIRTPAKRLKGGQLEFVLRCIAQNFSVDEILESLD